MVVLLSALACERTQKTNQRDDTVPVQAATVELRDVPREVETFGSVEASSTVEIVAQVQGLVTEVHFKEGDFVKRGDLLFSVDTRPYRASLAAAQADLSKNVALAAQAAREAERAVSLRSEGVASEQDVTKAKADAAAAAANVKLGQAQIQSASLNVQLARISAPISGRTGSLLVHAGNVVRPGDNRPLVVIRSLSPVFVRFAVAQDYLNQIRELFGSDALVARATTRNDAAAWVGGEGAKPVEGRVTFLENAVDPTTGTITLKATFDNKDQELWPGAAVDVVLVLGVERQVIVVPEAALQRTQAGTSVFVIDKQDRAELRTVDVLRTTRTFALLRSGVTAGEEVVTDGQLRLRQGSKISRKPQAPTAAASVAPPAVAPRSGGS